RRRLFGLAFGLAFGLTAALAYSLIVGVGKTPAQRDEPKDKTVEPAGKGQRAKDFIAAFERGDAKAIASFWTPDGDYVDQVGRHIKGREAIEKLYARLFAGRKGGKLSIIVTSARFVTPDVAIEDGITEVTSPEGGPPTSAGFSAVLVKKDGVWY